MRQLLLRAHLAPDRFLAQGRAYYFEATFYDAIMTSGTNLPLGTSQKSFSCWFRTSTPYLYSEYMWSCGQIKPDSLLGARLFYVNGVDAGLQSLCITVGIISISRELRMELGINMWSL